MTDNNRLQLPDNTYFPFTHTISDLENINIIGMPASKTITIPRTPQNDELFGYICDITRNNFGFDDFKYGVSFNQIKKCEYRLANESEIISEGIINVDDITDTEYKITLYDKIIQKLEDLEGDEETGDYFLTAVNILDGSNVMSFASNAFNIKDMNDNLNKPIIPVVGIKDNQNDIADNKIRCTTISGATSKIDDVDLPTDCTSLQLRTLKNYEFNYATPLTNVIGAINNKYNNVISVDDTITDLFDETYMLLNGPVNDENVETGYNVLKAATSYYTGGTLTYPIQNSTGSYICTENGHKYFNMDFQIQFSGITPSIIIGGLDKGDPIWSEIYYTDNSTTPNGTLFSKMWVRIYISNKDNSTAPIYYEMDFYKNVNTVINNLGSNLCDTITLTTKIVLDLDFYPQFDLTPNTDSLLHLEILNYNPANPTYKYKLLGGSWSVKYIALLSSSSLTEYTLPFRTNDIVTTQKIMPKVSIKEFIIQIAKFYNLDISINQSNNSLKLQPKKYYITDETPLIKSIDGMSTSNITFNKLKLIPTLPTNDAFDAYESKYKTIYGSQIIDTGYSIKNNIKEITIETAITPLMRDFNSFAYHNFTGYLNGGYAKNNHGIINELSDKITLCYVQRVNEKLYVTDDTPYEGGMDQTGLVTITGVTESTFLHYNPDLIVNLDVAEDDSRRFSFYGGTGTTYGMQVLDHYYTPSPYYWYRTTINKSLEMNKPNINYAGIPDSWYPSGSTLYSRFHRNMLIDKYNSDTHILSVKMFIDGVIDIYKIYNYQNSWYIISQITEYDPTKPDFYSVKLMRVNDPNNYINNIIL